MREKLEHPVLTHLIRSFRNPLLSRKNFLGGCFMKTLMQGFTAVLIVMLFLAGCSSTPEAATPEEPGYRIGDTGPGGGIVFYDDSIGISIDGKAVKDILPDGLRYLEAAPPAWSDASAFLWGYYNVDIPGFTFSEDIAGSIGKGRGFSEKIMAVEPADADSAVQACSAYTGGGMNDWYLPSHGELYVLFLNRDVVGGFQEDYYWSSSAGADSSSSYAQAVNFEDGWISTDRFRDTAYGVRPIRTF